MTNALLPNAFQTPNVYVDQAMELLTGEEYKCLSFATRHILGWQDKISTRQGAISFTMFERGYTTSKGDVYGGTGLSRRAIQRALDDGLIRYQLLLKRETTAGGQVYEVCESPDWDGLKQRQQAALAKGKQRTSKARSARRSGKSDKPALVSPTNQQIVSQTNQSVVSPTNQQQLVPLTNNWLVGLTESIPYTKPYQSQEEKESVVVEPSPETAKAIFEAVVESKHNTVPKPYTDAELEAQKAAALAKYGGKAS